MLGSLLLMPWVLAAASISRQTGVQRGETELMKYHFTRVP